MSDVIAMYFGLKFFKSELKTAPWAKKRAK